MWWPGGRVDSSARRARRQRQVLGDVGLGERQAVGDPADRHGSFSQQVRHLEAPRVGEGLENLGLELVDRFHAPRMGHMHVCASVPSCPIRRDIRPDVGEI